MVGQQLVDARGGVGLHAHQDVLEVCERVDAVALGGLSRTRWHRSPAA
jgi:hypothetical protein